MEKCSLLILTSRCSCHGVLWNEYRGDGLSLSTVGPVLAVLAAHTDADSLHGCQRNSLPGGIEQGVLAEPQHLQPAGVIDLDHEDAIPHVEQSRVRRKRLSGDLLPLGE